MDIPPDIPVSAAQAGFQAREVSRGRESQQAGDAQAARSQSTTRSEVSDIVETTDQDVSVFADAEGTGSQGRSRPEAEEEETPADLERTGISTDESGRLHVDLEA